MALDPRTAAFHRDPLGFMRVQAVSPPDGIEVLKTFGTNASGGNTVNYDVGVTPSTPVATEGTFARFFRPGTDVPEGAFKRAAASCPVGWIKFEPHASPGLAGALTFTVKREARARGLSPVDRVPTWFLPWQSNTLVEMTIPRSSGLNEDDPNDPRIFFTAAINGCSVMVRGDAREPTIVHAGISQGQTPYGNQPGAFWRDLLCAEMASIDDRRRLFGVHNTDYVNQTGVSGRAFTQNTDDYRQWLRALPPNGYTVEDVIPWGAVFGIRYGSLWSFYLQENATVRRVRIERRRETVTYQRLVQEPKRFGGYRNRLVDIAREEDVDVRVDDYRNVPVRVRAFFPEGGSQGSFQRVFRPV